MKIERARVIKKSGLVAILVLVLTSWCAFAGTAPTLDEQLIDAAKKGNLALVKSLLDKGAHINAKDEIALTPLRWAVLQSHPAVVTLLIDKGADVNEEDAGGMTALMEAAAKGYLGVVKVLLDKGADVNAVDKEGGTALMRAASFAALEIVKLLIERGARVNAVDRKGSTALMSAAHNKQPEVTKLLIAKGANVNAIDKSGRTALWSAALEGKLKNLSLLIKKGANVDVVTEDGSTPLMIAAQGGSLEIVRLLMENGADLNTVSKHNRTALGLAEAYGQTDLVRYLRAHASLRRNASLAQKDVPEYPTTPAGVVEAFIKAALTEVPITVEEMRSCSDISEIQYRYLPKDEDIKANRKTQAIDPSEPWGPRYGKWHIVNGFEVKEVKKNENRAGVKILYKRLGWFQFDPFRFKITNDTQEVTYGVAKPGKVWRIIRSDEHYISVGSAIKRLECKTRELASKEQKLEIKQDITILEQHLGR